MKWFKSIALSVHLFAVILMANVAMAQETPITDTGEVKLKLRTFSEKTSSIKCDFKQVKTIQYVKDPLVSSGQFYYSAPDKIRWDQTAPHEYIILIVGDEMKVKKDGKEKNHDLQKSRSMAAFRDVLLGIINGDILNGKQFNVEYFQTSTDYVLHLTPLRRAGKQQFSLVKLSFSKSNMSLKTISLTDKDGDHTLITFIDPVFNEPINRERYTKF